MKFDKLRQEYQSQIKQLAHRLNGYLRYIGDDDLAQEALLRLWQLSERGELEGKNRSYIMRGLYFHLKNYIRVMDDSRRLVYFDDVTSPVRNRTSNGAAETEGETWQPVDERACRSITEGTLSFELLAECLTEREREVLGFTVDGYTTREIGKKLDISHVRVVKILSNVRRKCHEKILPSIGDGADEPYRGRLRGKCQKNPLLRPQGAGP